MRKTDHLMTIILKDKEHKETTIKIDIEGMSLDELLEHFHTLIQCIGYSVPLGSYLEVATLDIDLEDYLDQ